MAAAVAGAVSGAASRASSYIFKGSMETITGHTFDWSLKNLAIDTGLGAIGGFAGGGLGKFGESVVGKFAPGIMGRLFSGAGGESGEASEGAVENFGRFWHLAETGRPYLKDVPAIIGARLPAELFEDSISGDVEKGVKGITDWAEG